MLNLSAFNHNHHPSRVKMVAKFIRRGIRVLINLDFKTSAIILVSLLSVGALFVDALQRDLRNLSACHH